MCHLQEEDLDPLVADLNSFGLVPFNFFFKTAFSSVLTDLLPGSGANRKSLARAGRSGRKFHFKGSYSLLAIVI